MPKQLTPERVPDATYQYRPNPARFQGVTSYNAEFTPKRSAVVEPQHPNPEMVYERKKIPFQGQSSYNQQFQPYHITPAKPESEYKYRPNTAKFNGTTRYNEVSPVLLRTTTHTSRAHTATPLPTARSTSCLRTHPNARPASATSTTAPKKTTGSDFSEHKTITQWFICKCGYSAFPAAAARSG